MQTDDSLDAYLMVQGWEAAPARRWTRSVERDGKLASRFTIWESGAGCYIIVEAWDDSDEPPVQVTGTRRDLRSALEAIRDLSAPGKKE